jgi:archaellum component FlaC
MNTRQIVNKFNYLQEEMNELKKSLDVIEEEIGRGTKTYALLLKEYEDVRKQLNIFGNTEWFNEIK